MGRNVVINALVGGASISEILHGEVELEPTMLRLESTSVIYPSFTKQALNGGKTIFVNVEPSPAGPEPAWAYRVTVRNLLTGRTWTEIVGVPEGTDPIYYSRLPRFTTVIPPETTPEQLQNWAESTKTNADRAEAAAAAAQAPTDTMMSTLLQDASSGTSKTLQTGLDLRDNPALGVALSAFTRAKSQPVSIVPLGSSTTAGTDQAPETRWVNKVARALQNSFAYGPHAQSPVGTLDSAKNSNPGVHVYNGGVSGARSDTYLSSAKVSQIAAIAPSIITHMIGSNDANHGYSAATFKGNLLGWIDSIDAVLPTPHVHVLIHAHERSDSNITALWNEYREVLRSIAISRPKTVAFVDLSREYEALGFPLSDPLDFLKDDLVHLTPDGHDFTGRLLIKALGAEPKSARRTAIRDTFNRANGSLGVADSGQPWQVPAGGFNINSNKMALTAAGTALIEAGASDIHLHAKVTHTGASSVLTGLVFRAKDNDNRLGFFINAGSGQQTSLNLTRDGSNTTLWTEPITLSPGEHDVDVVVVGNFFAAYINGTLFKTYELPASAMDATSSFTKVGVRCGSSDTSMRWDEFEGVIL